LSLVRAGQFLSRPIHIVQLKDKDKWQNGFIPT
jgi:hypothetical protein